MKPERVALGQFVNFSNQAVSFDGKSQIYQKKYVNLTTQVYEESQSVDKQNRSMECGKKVKLKLKTNPSKEFERKTEVKSVVLAEKHRTEKIQDNNYGSKIVNKKGQNTSNQNTKKRQIGKDFKPNVVYFELKSLKEDLKPSEEQKKCNKEQNIQQVKERPKVKNYQLSSFLSQIISKLASFYPKILTQSATLKDLSFQGISYSDVLRILCQLGMIRYSSQEKYNIESEDQKNQLQKVFLLWKILKINQTHIQSQSLNTTNPSILNFIVILAAIYNISFESVEQLAQMIIEKNQQISAKQIKPSPNNQLKNQPFQEPNRIFFIRNKTLLKQFQFAQFQQTILMNPNEQIKTQISKEFQLFRLNRLKIQNHLKHSKQNLEIQSLNAQPTIQSLLSPKSHQLAMTRRLKILEEIQNSQENSTTKQSNCQIDLNFFLNYKKAQSYGLQNDSKASKELFKRQMNQQNHKQVAKQTALVSKNKSIPSQKIKFSQLNVVLNMEKARKIKHQKQVILQKGWTNSGKKSQRTSKLNQTQQKKQSIKQMNSLAKSLQKSKSLGKVSQSRRNLLQKRKHSIQVLSNNQGTSQYDRKQKYEKKQEVIEDNQDDKNTVIRHQSEDDSDDEISINQLQPIEHQNRNWNNEDDFLIEHDEPFDKLNESLNNNSKNKNNNSEQLNPYEPQSSSKTFRTQVNDEIYPQDPPSNSKKTAIQHRPSQQARVIKSYLKIPILYVDVNMDESKKERIIIYEEDNPTNLAQEFGKKHALDQLMVGRLEQMLKEQISGILGRIDEEQEDDDDETKDNISIDREIRE